MMGDLRPTQHPGAAMESKLRAARLAMGWTQGQTLDAMEDAAVRLGVDLGSRASLKAQLSMFENGRRPPGPKYQPVFREIYRMTNAELGFPEDGRAASGPVLPAAAPLPAPGVPRLAGVSAGMIPYLQSVLVQHMQAEPMVGPRLLAPPVQAQMPIIEQLCQ